MNRSPKGNKRQMKGAENFDDLQEKVVIVPRKGPRGKGKAPPKGKGRAKPQPKEVVEGEVEEDPAEDATGTSRRRRTRSRRGRHQRGSPADRASLVADSDDEVAITKGSEMMLADGGQVSDPLMAQQNPNVDEASQSRDAKVSLNFVIDSGIVLMLILSGGPRKYTTAPQARQIQDSRRNRQSLGSPLLPVLRPPSPDSTTVTLLQVKKS